MGEGKQGAGMVPRSLEKVMDHSLWGGSTELLHLQL